MLRSSTVSDVLRRSASRQPTKTALHFTDRSWTYRELDDAVTRAAAWLLQRGLTKGDRVATYGKNSDAYLIAFLACARAGLVHVPINFALTGDELQHFFDDSGASLVMVDPSLMPHIETVNSPEAVLLRDGERSLLDAARSPEPPPTLDIDVSDTDLAQLLYTSGTTSRPKGAMMTHRALVHEYVSSITALDFTADDDPLHVMPLYHSAQMHVFVMPQLMIGATNTLIETPDPTDVLQRLTHDGHRSFFAAPTLWVAIANLPGFADADLPHIRTCYYGASIMPGPILERLTERMPNAGFYNCFGQSEIAPLACVLRPEEHDERPNSAGRPVLMVEMKVVDPEGNEVEPGGTGEVVYRSPQLCEGYWNNPEATAEAFRDGWFHSGDLVRIDDAGYIEVVDRIRDVINTGGVLVASREVEDALYTHEQVAEVAVVGVPHEKWVEAVHAVVVPKEDARPDPDELIEHVRERLAPFKVPKSIELARSLPRNASGKILKRQLRRS